MDPLRLVGTWDFRREIRHADGTQYAADGGAELTPQEDGRIRWAERGTLRWATGSTPVTRTLFLVREPPPDDGAAPGWRVTFEDGRDFHPWTAGAVEHLCGRDLYRGGIDLPAQVPARVPAVRVPADSWDLRWHVTGPEKDYLMHTWYARRP
ncbi:DUF6314 family protein [Promicromonospora sp. MEB111]|uniref:DUF6314 family protein n=1 Tax=Promicromonospora sp. MEB111 TaxID=3040301 RepID=UPI0025518858|nr:DUF6314 family protein [Promicromonospora sp. MEB111]